VAGNELHTGDFEVHVEVLDGFRCRGSFVGSKTEKSRGEGERMPVKRETMEKRELFGTR